MTGFAWLSFERDGRDWPNRGASRFVEAAGLRWHVQTMGQGPALLLLHGTGASTHSWRDLAPLLAAQFQVIAPDLPGHAFTDPMRPGETSLPGMARAIGGLLKALGIEPDVVVGHSAGAAVLAHLCLRKTIAPRLLVSLNGAFLPFEGLAGLLFPPMARLLLLNPLTPRLFAWSADRASVARLLRGTGSAIDPVGLDLYTRLLGNPGHVAGALAMMANWDLDALSRDLRRLATPVELVAADKDRAVPPETAARVRALLPAGRISRLTGVGHLAHEEQPVAVSTLILKYAVEITASGETGHGNSA